MATQALTARTIDALKPAATRYEVFDALTPTLALRVTPTGHKSWVIFYRHHGRLRRLTLGRYPDVGLGDARRRAIQERGRVAGGADPATERTDERATYGDTIGALYDVYKHTAEKKASWREQRRLFEKDVLPAWRHRRVQDITRRDIRQLLDRKAQTSPVMANRLLAWIRRLLSFAVDREWITANPAWRMAKPGEEKSRDRVLSREELRILWAALQESTAEEADGRPLPRLSETLNDLFMVMLLTAQRGGEVARMRWQDVDLDRGAWMIPAEGSKNHDPHHVPLTAPVVAILRRRHEDRDDRYVFSNHQHTCVADRAKKAASELCRGLSFEFRAHDLRRTAASYMGEAGIDRFHIAHVLNHRSVTHSSVTAIYDRYRYDKEKRLALDRWAAVLHDIVSSGQESRQWRSRRMGANTAARRRPLSPKPVARPPAIHRRLNVGATIPATRLSLVKGLHT
jgi:integrase